MIAALAYLGRGDRDCAGSAAQRALSARAALPPGRARMIIEIKPHRRNRFDAARLSRSAAIGGRTLGPISRGGAILPTDPNQIRLNGGDMNIDDALGFFSPTGCVALPEFGQYHAYSDSAASSSPNEYRVAVLACAAYSRSASVSSRYAFPTLFDSQAVNSLAS
jgi:hypothetical protein